MKKAQTKNSETKPPSWMTPDAVADWLRVQAKMFMQFADFLETFQDIHDRLRVLPPDFPVAAATHRDEHRRKVVLERAQSSLNGKAFRRADLARMIEVEVRELDGVLTPENGFHAGERGWIRFKRETAKAT